MFSLSLIFAFTLARRRTITTETSDFFQSLQDYDLFHFDSDHSPHFFHHLENRFYPVKGELKFTAFGQDYHIELEKNQLLFGEDFKVTNNNGTHVTDMDWDHETNNCYYHGTILNDDEPSTVALMACQGHGMKGLIMGHGRTISIKPSLPHVDVNSEDTPTVHDEHLVYHIGDVDRKHDKSAHLPTECDVGHEMEFVPDHMQKLKETDPDLHDHIVKYHIEGHHHHHHHSHDTSDSDSDSSEEEHEHMHEHHHSHNEEDHHHRHNHGHHEHEDELVKGIHRYHENIEKLFTTKPVSEERRQLQINRAQQRYVEMLIVNDPARTISHFGCYQTNDDTIPSGCNNLVQDTLAIFSIVTALYRDQPWDYNIQLVVTHMQNWFNHDCNLNEDGTPINSQYCVVGETPTQPSSVYGYRTGNSGSSGCVTTNGWSVGGDLQSPSKYVNGEARAGTSNYCEASYIDYLSKWHSWRISSGAAPQHDNAQLFSYYDFYSTVIGYATLRSMCGSYSGGINQMTYDHEYNAGIIAHEMGHNWGMRHDSDGNSCDPANSIMASTGSPNGYRPNQFSSCSITYLDDFIESKGSQLVCLDNEPLPPEYGVCGNGFLEQGEQCDCGQSDCSTIDPCCDGSICALKAGNECSIGQPCCGVTTENGLDVCKIVSADSQKVCRTKSESNTCDVQAEMCDGTSATCPFNEFKLAGEACYVPGAGTEQQPDGECWDGTCHSQYSYCISLGYGTCDILQIRVDDCNQVTCQVGNDCVIIPGDDSVARPNHWPDGTPCALNGNDAGLCQRQSNGQSICKAISQMRAYMWWAGPFSECSATCYPSSCSYSSSETCSSEGCEWNNGVCNFPPKGTQTREVWCYDMSGNVVDDSNCVESEKLNEESYCNDIPCGDCDLNCGTGTCAYEGDTATTAVKTCICANGYSGDNCENEPSVRFLGITSIKGSDQALDEDPRCVATSADETCSPLVQNGDNLGLTWATEGSPDYFAIGVKREGDEFAFYPDASTKPIYQNKITATDSNGNTIQCDSGDISNETSALCQDGSWFFNPEEGYHGNYTLEIRYNNLAYVETPKITVRCSEYICGEHGSCGANDRCVCDEHYSGPYCTSTFCSPWIFIDESAIVDSLSSSSYNVSRCHDHGTCNPANGVCTCDEGWDGEHCEIADTKEDTCDSTQTAFMGQSCQHGSVRVFSEDDPCESTCDCDQVNRQSLSNAATQHWRGDLCDTCGITCVRGTVDADCTTCIDCGNEYAGDRCQDLFWVSHFKIEVAYEKINSVDKNKFSSTLLEDIAYALNDNLFPASRFDVYSMKPDGTQTIIFFKLIFPTASTSEAQIYGGGVMIRLKDLAGDPESSFYRGMLTGFADHSFGIADACIPSFENCDPDVKDRFSEYLMYCFLGSFGFELLMMLIWHLWTKKRKWKKYQERVKKVAERLQKLQANNEIRGGRQQFKLKPVSRKDARKIYLASKKMEENKQEEQKRKEKEAEELIRQEELEEQRAIDQVKKMEEANKKARKKHRKSGPGANPNMGEAAAHRGGEGEPGAQPGSIVYPGAAVPGAAAAMQPGASAPGFNNMAFQGAPGMPALPKGWIEYRNKDGLPYYYNKKTKTTTWNHPALG